MPTVPAEPSLFTEDIPFLDVRAPVEFEHGAFPSAHNLPILSDDERHQVGVCYKEKGPEAAVKLGHELVSGDVKAQRIDAWAALARLYPDLHLYCFRGGQRSQIAADWLSEAGIDIPRVEGGYKALRRILIDVLEDLPRLVVIGGKTGVGKTRFLDYLPSTSFVDLEGHANHRGSAFGKRLTPQPAQIDFENAIAIDFLRAGPLVFVEDESRMIGAINLPLPLREAMKTAPLLLVEADIESRVEHIFDEYVVRAQQELELLHNDEVAASEMLRQKLQTSLDAIQKRLGGDRHRDASALLQQAFESEGSASAEAHKAWIRLLLVDYYDPMYEYQLSKKTERVVARGNAAAMAKAAEEMLERGA